MLLFAPHALADHLAGLQDELHAPLRVGLREDVRAGGCLFRRGEGLVGVLVQVVLLAAAGLAVGVVLAGALVDDIEMVCGQCAVAEAAGAGGVFMSCLHRSLYVFR